MNVIKFPVKVREYDLSCGEDCIIQIINHGEVSTFWPKFNMNDMIIYPSNKDETDITVDDLVNAVMLPRLSNDNGEK